jgi:tRNA nucleotidyltransferase/poly(A) polymerase
VEDPTRILRAVRFKERLGFSLEEKTAGLMRQALKSGMFSRVSSARIFDELVHMLKESCPHRQIFSLSRICGLGFIDSRIKVDSETLRLMKKAEQEIKWFKTSFADKRKPDSWLVYLIILLDKIKGLESMRKIIIRFNLRKEDSKRIFSYRRATK